MFSTINLLMLMTMTSPFLHRCWSGFWSWRHAATSSPLLRLPTSSSFATKKLRVINEGGILVFFPGQYRNVAKALKFRDALVRHMAFGETSELRSLVHELSAFRPTPEALRRSGIAILLKDKGFVKYLDGHGIAVVQLTRTRWRAALRNAPRGYICPRT